MLKKTSKLLGIALITGVAVYLAVRDRFEELFLGFQLSSVRRVLLRQIGAERADRLLAETRNQYRDLAGAGIGDATPVLRFHSAFLRFGMALYRAIRETLPEEGDAVERTHRLLWEGGMSGPSRAVGFLLGLSPDPFGLFTKGVRLANRHLFCEPYWQREDIDVPEGIGFDYTGCPYDEFCREHGIPELTRAFCDMDWRMAEQFPGVEMRREHTLSAGDDRCDFRYYRGLTPNGM